MGNVFSTAYLDIQGNLALVGNVPSDPKNSPGTAQLFDVTTGNLLHTFSPPDGQDFDRFGSSAVLTDNTAIISSDNKNHEPLIINGSLTLPARGEAYRFDLNTLAHIDNLKPIETGQNTSSAPFFISGINSFGEVMAVSGNTLLVGSPADEFDELDSGAAYLFDLTTGNQTHRLLAPNSAEEDLFGYDVAISGNTAAVATLRRDSIFLFDTNTGQLIDTVSAGNGYDTSIAMNDQYLLVARAGISGTGNVLVYDAQSFEWLDTIYASDVDYDDFHSFASTVAIQDNYAIIGNSNQFGAPTYVVQLPEPASAILLTLAALPLLPRRRRA